MKLITLFLAAASLPAFGQLTFRTYGFYFPSIGGSVAATNPINGGVPPLSYSISSGTLPPGLSLDATTGVISGTPTVFGNWLFQISVRDSTNQTGSHWMGGVIGPFRQVVPPNAAKLGLQYGDCVVAIGPNPPYSVSILSGSLPQGMFASSTVNGLCLSGIPTGKAADYPLSLSFTSAVATSFQQSITFSVTGPSITTQTLPPAITTVNYSQTILASGGRPPYKFSLAAGNLPLGLGLSESGIISGIAGPAGSTTFSVKVTDADGSNNTSTITLTVESLPPPVQINTDTLPIAAAGIPYGQAITASGGKPPYTFALLSGSLPSGLVLLPSGVLGGSPAATGTFTFTAQVTDSIGLRTTRQLTLMVVNRPSFSRQSTISLGGGHALLARGGLFSIYGANLAASTAAASFFPLPTTLAGTTVALNGNPIPLLYVSPTQINAQLPNDAPETANLILTAAMPSDSVPISIRTAAPAILTYEGKRAVALNQDYSVNGPSKPAPKRSVISLYLTGCGEVTNPVAAGVAAPTSPLSEVRVVPGVRIGEQAATVLFAGLAPGFAGLCQFNIQVPTLVGSGDLAITVGDSNEATLSVAP